MAMENGTLSASDVALLSGNNGMWGDGSFMWIFALLILAGGGFNGFGWGNGFGYQPQYATQDFVQNGFNFNNLLDQNRDILNAISKDTADTITAIKDGNAATIREFGNVESALATAIQQQQTCCCEVQRNIDAVNCKKTKGQLAFFESYCPIIGFNIIFAKIPQSGPAKQIIE